MKLKRILSIAICALLCLALLPTAVVAAGGTKVLVNGENILEAADYTVTCGEGTAVYNPVTLELTLNNATINTRGIGTGSAGIVTDGDLTVILVGANVIDLSASMPSASGVWADGNLTISSSSGGSLQSSGALVSWSAGDIKITGSVITVNSQSNNRSSVWSRNGSIYIENSTVTANGSYGALLGEKDIIIAASTVNSSCTVSGYNAIGTSGGKIEIKENSKITASAVSSAIYSTKEMVIDGSVVSSESTSSFGIASASTLDIQNGSDITAKGNGSGLSSGTNITISESKVQAAGATAAGIASNYGSIEVIGSYDITSTGTTAYFAYTGLNLSLQNDNLIELKVGSSESDAQHFDGSPYSAGVTFDSDDMNTLGSYTYAHVRVHTHVFDREVSSTDYLASEATCKEYASYYYSCECGAAGTATFSGTQLAEHVVSSALTYDDAGHWNACSTCDDKLNYEAHTLDFVIERYPTEAVSGSGHYECSVCGYVSASVPTYSAQPIPETVVTPPQPSDEDTSDVTLDEDNVPGSDVTIDEPVQSGQSDKETDGSEDSEQESSAPNPQTGLIAPMGIILAAAMAALVGKRG